MKNIKLNFLHVCDYVSFAEGGKLNIIGIFKNIITKSLPATHKLMYVVFNFTTLESKEYQLSIKIINSKNDKEIINKNLNINIDIPKGQKKAEIGMTAPLNDIIFEEYGNYKIQVSLDDNIIGEAEIELVNAK